MRKRVFLLLPLLFVLVQSRAAADLSVSLLETSAIEIEYGKTTDFRIQVVNHRAALQEIDLALYARLGESRILVQTIRIEAIDSAQVLNFVIPFSVPDSLAGLDTLTQVQIWATIDPQNAIAELSENNNTKELNLPLVFRFYQITDIKNYPNPFRFSTVISYQIEGRVKRIDITIFSENSVKLAGFENAPRAHGENTVVWYTPTLESGTYFFRIKATDINQTLWEYSGKMLKITNQ